MAENRFLFTNPYNFIPLAGKRATGTAAAGQEKTYTGVIAYSVLTKTPLFIPNTSNSDVYRLSEKEPDHKSYDFFTYTDLSEQEGPAADAMPVIPGSEMRGMFRSNFEILTNSCMSSVDDDMTLSKRTNQTFQAGLIQRKQNADGTVGFDLYEADDCLMRTMGKDSLTDDWQDDRAHYSRQCYIQKDLKEGAHVYFRMERRKSQDGRRWIKPLAKNVSAADAVESGRGMADGYILKGESGPDMNGAKQQKHCCHIFALKNGTGGPQPVAKNISLDTLMKVLREYRSNGVHFYTEYTAELERFRQGKSGETYYPVYFSYDTPGYDGAVQEKKRLMLSPACITREIYGRKIRDMIGSYRSCESKTHLCPACSLFGTVSGNLVKASRIRFSDLVCQAKSASACFMEPVTLPPLSSPKLNNMEFYLERPSADAVFWTYDYYFDKDGNIHPNDKGINGRKFYWHNLKPDLKSVKPDSQNMTVHPVKTGIVFAGKLYFQDVTKTELDQMIYLLGAGEEGEIGQKRHGYKLGGAKPLGLGSIAVSVDAVTLNELVKDAQRRRVERKEVAYEEYREPEFDQKILENFSKMTDFYAVEGQKVSYPLPKDAAAGEEQHIFDWFVNNHRAYRYNKREGAIKSVGMPNSRKEMAYADYMQAMNPMLMPTAFRELVGEPITRQPTGSGRGQGTGGNRSSNGSRTGAGRGSNGSGTGTDGSRSSNGFGTGTDGSRSSNGSGSGTGGNRSSNGVGESFNGRAGGMRPSGATFQRSACYEATVSGFSQNGRYVKLRIGGQSGQIAVWNIPGAIEGNLQKLYRIGQVVSVVYIDTRVNNGITYHNFRPV